MHMLMRLLNIELSPWGSFKYKLVVLPVLEIPLWRSDTFHGCLICSMGFPILEYDIPIWNQVSVSLIFCPASAIMFLCVIISALNLHQRMAGSKASCCWITWLDRLAESRASADCVVYILVNLLWLAKAKICLWFAWPNMGCTIPQNHIVMCTETELLSFWWILSMAIPNVVKMQSSQWWKFHQNRDISVTVWAWCEFMGWLLLPHDQMIVT